MPNRPQNGSSYLTLFITEILIAATFLCCNMTSVAAHYRPTALIDAEDSNAEWQPFSSPALYTYYGPPTDNEDAHLDWQNLLHAMNRKEDTKLKTANKRALSILTRWRSLAGAGRRTNALTKSPRAPMSLMQTDLDGGAKDMPGRRIGGPLRWGR